MTEAAESPCIPGTTIRFAWDATSLGILKQCPKNALYALQEGWAPRSTGTHLLFGQLYHTALENFVRLKTEGATREEALRQSVFDAIVGSRDLIPLKTKTRETLIQTIIWYVEHWQDDILQTVILPSGQPAVELSFRWQSDIPVRGESGQLYFKDDGTPYCFLFCGHLDRVVSFNGMNLVKDYKTSGSTLGSYYFDQFSPDNQMSFYPFMAEKAFGLKSHGVLIDAAQVGLTFSDFSRDIAHRTPQQLAEWWQTTQHYLRQYVTYAEANFWPMNDKSCRFCAFRAIDKKDPSVRSAFLKSDYDRKEPWNPLAVRTAANAGLDLSDAA